MKAIRALLITGLALICAPAFGVFSNFTHEGVDVSWPDCSWSIAPGGTRTYRMAINGTDVVPDYTNRDTVTITGLPAATPATVQIACVDNGTAYWGPVRTFVTLAAPAVDSVAPVLTRLGTSPVTVEGGSTYTTAGWTCTDDVDGSITPTVDVSAVNTSAVASYTETADCQDAAGNDAVQGTRTVDVVDTTAPTAPSVPTFSSATSTTMTVVLSGGTDAIGVTERCVYNSAVLAGCTSGSTYILTGLAASTAYAAITATAKDAAGNESAASAAMSSQSTLAGGGGGEATDALGNPCPDEWGLNGRMDILLCEDFSESDWYDGPGYVDGQSPTASAVDDTPVTGQMTRVRTVTGAECQTGACLEGDWLTGVERTLAIVWQVKAANAANATFPAAPETLFFRYETKFDSNWIPDQVSATEGNGKLWGIADGRENGDPGDQCGNGGATPDGTDCWTARGLFWTCEDKDGGDASFAPGSTCGDVPGGLARLGSYIYATGNGGETTGANGQWDGYGENQTRGGNGVSETTCRRSGPPGTAEHEATCYGTPYDNFYAGIDDDKNVIVAEQWMTIEMQCTMNDIGSDNGILRGWVNDVLVYEKTNMRYRVTGGEALHCRTIWLDWYKGGVGGNTQDGKSYADNMVVALNKIGVRQTSPLDSIAPGTWYQVADSNLDAIDPCPYTDSEPCVWTGGGFEGMMEAWSGAAYDTTGNRLLVAGGGHGDYWGNEVYEFPLSTLEWAAVTAPSDDAPDAANESTTGLYPDGTPRSRHTYNSLEYSPALNSLLMVGAQGTSPASIRGDNLTHRLSLTGTPAWSTLDDVNAVGGRIGSITRDPDSEIIWYQASGTGGIAKYDPDVDTWTAYTGRAMNIYSTAAYDSTRDHILVLGGSSSGNAWAIDVSSGTPSYVNISLDLTFMMTNGDQLDEITGPGLAYSPVIDRFVLWHGGHAGRGNGDVYYIHPTTWAITRVSPAGGNTVTPTAAESLGTYGRWRYIPSKDLFGVVNATHSDVYFYKAAEP